MLLGKAYIFPPNFLRKILNGVLLVTQFSDYCLLNVFFHYIFKDIVSLFIRYDYFFSFPVAWRGCINTS